MKSLIISSNSSGGGKTTVTLALMKALMKRGHEVQGYKVGPDYIDTAFHEKVTGRASRNLDLFLMEEAGVKESYRRGQGDLGIIEGVMGIYDGKGIDTRYSTAHLSKVLGLPVVLVLSPKAQAATLCAELQGLRNFENINISGVILNNIGEGYYRLLKASIEENCRGIKVFGYLPSEENISLKSRHLGLVQSSEVEDLDKKIERASALIEEYVDIEALVQVAEEAKIEVEEESKYHLKDKGYKIAVAKDEAFSFYYKENLELLSEVGKITYFSPLRDEKLPKADFIYFGGGYPEVFKEKLSSNKSMLKSIRDSLEAGVRCYAECGGLMYLTEGIEGLPMVGFFNGASQMTKRLNNFGYAAIEVKEENNLLPIGLKINCHEFHKSLVNLKEKPIYRVSKESFDGTIKEWSCGYVRKNTIAAYGHVHFFSNLDFLKDLLNY